MAKTVFAPGSTVTSTFLNAVNNPVFVDTPAADGEIARITNNDLSNAAGQIKQEWTTFRDALKVSSGSGLSVTYGGGAVTIPSGAIQTIVAGTLGSLANNTINYIYVDNTGAVVSNTSYPTIGLPLAAATTVSGAVTVVQDLRPRHTVLPIASSIRSFGGQSATDKTCTNGETLDQGVYYFRNFTVPAGVTITVSYGCRIYCSGSVSISGTINVTQAGIAPRNTSITLGTFSSGPGAGPNGLGQGTGLIPWGVQTVGTSGGQGSAGAFGTAGTFWYGVAGSGGGFFGIEAAGPIVVTSSGAINAPGSNAGAGTIGGSYVPGSVTFDGNLTGPGGGSGGQIALSSLVSVTLAAGSTANVQGGNGANSISQVPVGTNAVYCGGSAGGGGYIVLQAPTVNTTGATLALSGGNPGTSSGRGFSVSGNDITLTTANSASAPNNGGGYAGAPGTWGYVTSTLVRYTPAGSGLLVVRNSISPL